MSEGVSEQRPLLDSAAGSAAQSMAAPGAMAKKKTMKKNKKQKKTSPLGLASLFVLIISWVGQSEVSKFLQKPGGAAYNAPFFITVLNQSCMVVALSLNFFLLPRRDVCSPGAYLKAHGLSVRTVALHSLYLAAVYCSSTYFWFRALGRAAVNVAIASGLYNSSVVWVFLLSLACRMEAFSIPKAVGVVLALAGVGMGSVSSGSAAGPSHNVSSPSPLQSPSMSVPYESSISHMQLGYVEVVGSAMLYAVFEVLLNRVTNAAGGNKATAKVPLAVANFFTGGVGLVHIFCLSLLLWPMDALAIEPFNWPTPDQWGLLWINAGLGTLFNVSFCTALVMTTPLFVSVSCLLTIPMSACVDLFYGQANFTGLQVGGMLLICAGFLCFLGLCGENEEEEEKEEEEEEHGGDV
jgi:drug/metabolite transporter (DMT)-like permease